MKRSGSVSGNNAYTGYWRVYGGLASFFSSIYVWIAFSITIVSKEIWLPVKYEDPAWISLVFSVAPSLLGFALGGMAIMLAFSGGLFLNAIREGGRHDSFFMKMIASFFHFVLTLTTAIIVGFFCKLNWLPVPLLSVLSAIGYFLTLYGILLVAQTAASIWYIARIYNHVQEISPASPALSSSSQAPAVTTAPAA
jgi:hypothetical protein